MFGFNLTEILVIGVVALIVFGPEKLPKVMSELGKWAGEMKKSTDGLRRELYNSAYRPTDELKSLSQEISGLFSSKPKPIIEVPTVSVSSSFSTATTTTTTTIDEPKSSETTK